MTKRERERIEREKLKRMLENPSVKTMVEAMVNDPDTKPELKEIVEQTITLQLEKTRMDGIRIGWNAAMLGIGEKLNKFQNLDEAKEFFTKEAKIIQDKLGIEL